MSRLSRLLLVSFASAFVLAPVAALAIDPVYENWRGLAIRGTDPVAYFTEGKPVEGRSEYSLEWQGSTWRFASAANKAAFESEPERYAPQYGGYCAWAVSQGYTASVDPDAWAIVDGRLYLNYSQSVAEKWQANRAGCIAAADVNWPALLAE